MINFKIILASGSPRRKELLASMNIPFEVIMNTVNEDYPESLKLRDVPLYLAEKKSYLCSQVDLGKNSNGSPVLLLTADTVVVLKDEILGKPSGPKEAKEMLGKLSGQKHEVITGVCLRNQEKKLSFSDCTFVQFSSLTDSWIEYYVNAYKPFDKAGAYGIQEWIGAIGIESIQGSYTNVMGLPTEKLFRSLNSYNTKNWKTVL